MWFSPAYKRLGIFLEQSVGHESNSDCAECKHSNSNSKYEDHVASELMGCNSFAYLRSAAMNDNVALIRTVSRNGSWWLIGGTSSWGSRALAGPIRLLAPI